MLDLDSLIRVIRMQQALGSDGRDGCPGIRHPDDPRLRRTNTMGHLNDQPNYDDLDPGIREMVRWLRTLGFNTTDSGDGVTKKEAIADGDALDMPHVAITCPPYRMVNEAQRLMKAITDRIGGGSIEPGDITASFDPADDSAVIMLVGIDDAAMGFEKP